MRLQVYLLMYIYTRKVIVEEMQAIIFDMDGVIIDSEKFWQQAEEEVFSSLGVTVTEEFSAQTKSMTTGEVARFWYEKYPWQSGELQQAEQMVVTRVIELIEQQDCAIEGVKAFIERHRAKGFKIGLATNSPQRIIPVVLNKLGISHLFDAVSSAESEEKGKPDPAVYTTTAEKLNVMPAHCFAIEDSHSGMLAAKSAGMTVLAFTNGNSMETPLASYHITDFGSHTIETY